jgi:hypothetical protein
MRSSPTAFAWSSTYERERPRNPLPGNRLRVRPGDGDKWDREDLPLRDHGPPRMLIRAHHLETPVKRRTIDLIEEPGQLAGSRLLERGNWVGRESDTLVFAQLSYLAAQIWRGALWRAVDVFIEDNRQQCELCDSEWIVLGDWPTNYCPQCGNEP